MNTDSEQDESDLPSLDMSRMHIDGAAAFRMHVLYPNLRRIVSDTSKDTLCISKDILHSRRIELLIEQMHYEMYNNTARGIRELGIPAVERIPILEDMRSRIWEDDLPEWVGECLRLGSWVPLIEHMVLIVQPTKDDLVFMYLCDVAEPTTP